jgi:hypothetical protein
MSTRHTGPGVPTVAAIVVTVLVLTLVWSLQ